MIWQQIKKIHQTFLMSKSNTGQHVPFPPTMTKTKTMKKTNTLREFIHSSTNPCYILICEEYYLQIRRNTSHSKANIKHQVQIQH